MYQLNTVARVILPFVNQVEMKIPNNNRQMYEVLRHRRFLWDLINNNVNFR